MPWKLRRTRLAGALAIVLAAAVAVHAFVISPQLSLTNAAANDQDDICIWIHPTDPSLSTIIASDKAAGRVFVYDLQGQVVQQLTNADEPGNIDVRYGFPFEGEFLDIVAFNNRTTGRIQVYKVAPAARTLSRIDGNNLTSADNYGLCLYRSPSTGAFHVFTTTQTGLIRQFELSDSGSGLAMTPVRSWSVGSITEGCVADDETGQAYFGEEDDGIWKVGAEPGDPTPGTMIVQVGDASGLAADVEGLALYYAANGGGYLIASSQGNSRFNVYDRAAPHAPVVQFAVSGVSRSDGIDVTNVNLGAAFPFGLFACHNDNSTPKRVDVCAFEDLGLAIDTDYWNPRSGPATAVLPGDLGEGAASLQLVGWPNPFTRGTRMSFRLPRPGRVSLSVIDGTGRRVARLVNDEWLDAGSHVRTWNGRDAAGQPVGAGVYFHRLETESGTATRKVTRIR